MNGYQIKKEAMKKFLLLLSLISGYWASAQTTDDYTRYELLDPATNSFKILYDVSATTPGATWFHNTLRKGSEHKVDRVIDMASGKPLVWSIVKGEEARKNGLATADKDTEYLQIKLAQAVAKNSEYRILIDKTYADSKSYFAEGDKIVFDRSLGIKRNSVLLPKGYELTTCNYPSQIMMEADGRLKISFVNRGPDAVPLHIEGRKLARPVAVPTTVKAESLPPGQGRDKSKVRMGFNFQERAYQTREIVYFLQQPETHSFRLYHDYTETEAGINKYVNVVRAGSKASNPSALNLDTGQPLKVETLVGNAYRKKKELDIGSDFSPTAEAIVIWFDPVKKGSTNPHSH
ncbi:MAG: hypothetical protein U5K54_16165 [Cytophagales bacterium]|nr:hypothetical protein [Cytophagales bacterium]